MENITCHGQLSQKEFVMLRLFDSRKRLVLISLPFFLLVFIFLLLMNLVDVYALSGLAVLFWSLAITLLYYALGICMMYFTSQKIYQKDPYTRRTNTYFINEEYVFQQNERGEAKHIWEEIHQVFEFANMFIIYLAPTRAVVLPHRFFESKDDREIVKKTMKQCVDKDKLHLKKHS
ncbi:YcxB-like protein [Sinobaca qinghaiensis]|uniref:YcxB-like protein n=1 Tax=Sinobaca qinghaiensis TaxID=342944 RepID=A0A419V3U2_9BACL|nr:YcxB family protein [Sinobaca qinghaiensis]RKD73150.1 YcxB-like protein [Sinobaca qinghaiensis]